MSRKDAPLITATAILEASLRLFRDNGFINTNSRQIAAEAGVSVGLINHYFGSKRTLGFTALKTLIRMVVDSINYPQLGENEVYDDFVATRCVNEYLMGGSYRQFYMDCLREDLFFEYLSHWSTLSLQDIAKGFNVEVDDDVSLLYSRYIPYTVEKTLVLKKEDGLFKSISESDIPYRISLSTYANYLPADVLENADAQSRIFSKSFVPMLPAFPSSEQLRSTLEEQEPFIQSK